MKAILRTHFSETRFVDKIVDIDDNHDFAGGPYQDTVPFAVGSNQEILQLEDLEAVASKLSIKPIQQSDGQWIVENHTVRHTGSTRDGVLRAALFSLGMLKI